MIALALLAGSLLVAPHRRPSRLPPPHLHAETVALESSSGATLAAWLFVPPRPRAAAVVLHGVRASRADMLDRADLLWRHGLAVLVPDLQAHGESTGSRITFGYLESRDAVAALGYMRRRFPDLRTGAVGVSMGGAAIALAAPEVQPDAAVLEAVFPSLREAVDNRVAHRLGVASRLVTPLLLLQMKPRLGIGPDRLRPIESVRWLRCPVLVISGSSDWHTTETQTRALYTACAGPKELWLVPGAAHVDLRAFDPAGYEARVVTFLLRNLSREPAVGLPAAGE